MSQTDILIDISDCCDDKGKNCIDIRPVLAQYIKLPKSGMHCIKKNLCFFDGFKWLIGKVGHASSLSIVEMLGGNSYIYDLNK